MRVKGRGEGEGTLGTAAVLAGWEMFMEGILSVSNCKEFSSADF